MRELISAIVGGVCVFAIPLMLLFIGFGLGF